MKEIYLQEFLPKSKNSLTLLYAMPVLAEGMPEEEIKKTQ
jgi:hypothetical protein